MPQELRYFLFTLAASMLLLFGFVSSAEAFTFLNTVLPVIVSFVTATVFVLSIVFVCIWFDNRKGI